MPMSLTCPECGGKLRVADNLAGKRIKCPKCAEVFAVSPPEQDAITSESPPRTRRENVTAELQDDRDLDEEVDEMPRVRRRIRRNDADEVVSTLIPYKNGLALAAYYCGVFSLIPCVGMLLGPISVVLGILGLRHVKANPTAKGTGHAIAGIVLGTLVVLGHLGIAIVAFLSSRK